MTQSDIQDGRYGPHERNTFDLYFPRPCPGLRAAPLVIFIHGGGFWGGDKSHFNPADRERCLRNGVAFAAINYPFIEHKPLQEILRDIARAVQYLRRNADRYGIDRERISCYGVSAGAGASLFLAAGPDVADPNSGDPVARESAAIFSAGLYDTQSTYDFYQWPGLLSISMEQLLALQRQLFNSPLSVIYGDPVLTPEDFLKGDVVRIREFLDMTSHLSCGSCPVYIKTTVAAGNAEDILHAPVFSRTVYKRCREQGIRAELHTPESPGEGREFVDFLLELLGTARQAPEGERAIQI